MQQCEGTQAEASTGGEGGESVSGKHGKHKVDDEVTLKFSFKFLCKSIILGCVYPMEGSNVAAEASRTRLLLQLRPC